MPLTIYKKKGKWHLRGWVLGKNIRRSTGYPVGTIPARKGAEQFAAELEVRLLKQGHGFIPKPSPTLAEYWAKTYEPRHTALHRHARVERTMMAHALPEMGHRPLSAITREDCERYLHERRQSYYGRPGQTPKRTAEGTVQRERQFLAAVFEQAKLAGHLTVNPWRGIKATPYAVRVRLVTPEMQAVLIERLAPPYQRWLRFLLGTGLRLGECRGLTAADIDLTRRTVRVGAKFAKFGKARTVPLPAVLVPVVQAQLADEGRLWPQDPAWFRSLLLTACRTEPALPRISPHDLRHTFGHRWLKGGGRIHTLSKILGNTLAVCSKHYAHLLAEDIAAEADSVELGL